MRISIACATQDSERLHRMKGYNVAYKFQTLLDHKYCEGVEEKFNNNTCNKEKSERWLKPIPPQQLVSNIWTTVRNYTMQYLMMTTDVSNL